MNKEKILFQDYTSIFLRANPTDLVDCPLKECKVMNADCITDIIGPITYTGTLIWEGGCLNFGTMKSLIITGAQTMASCSEECHKVSWCIYFLIRSTDGKC